MTNTQILSINKAQPLTMNLQIPKAGCNIKENARIAVLYLLAR